MGKHDVGGAGQGVWGVQDVGYHVICECKIGVLGFFESTNVLALVVTYIQINLVLQNCIIKYSTIMWLGIRIMSWQLVGLKQERPTPPA